MPVFLLMGVAGSGKSTVGRALAERLGCPFVDGDDYHPPANIEKMSLGIPLTDEDRLPWLDALVRAAHSAGENVVVCCSALKEKYRTLLRDGIGDLTLVYLRIGESEASARVTHRTGHFMPTSLVRSQFDALEPPLHDALVLDAAHSVEVLVQRIIDRSPPPLVG
jgi:carbohydrate kinase (thermoresistant glucokinase family)